MKAWCGRANHAACLLISTVLLGIAPCAFSISGAFIKLDVPGAGSGAGEGTSPQAINKFGEIAGYFADDNGALHGFMRHKDGSIEKFDPPGASTAGGEGTFPQSMNDNGEIAGYFQTSPGSVRHGFVRHSDKTISTFDPPGSIGTVAQSINASGEITGNYVADDMAHGFVRHKDGSFTTFDPPGSANVAPMSINTSGEITGYFADDNNVRHGFVRRDDGSFDTFEPSEPSSAISGDALHPTTAALGTLPMSMNAIGEITGYFYAAPSGTLHGFVRQKGGAFAVFDPPGSIADGAVHQADSGYAARPVTAPVSINGSGEVAGYFADAKGILHGFIRHADGSFATFDAPEAGKSSDLGTFPLGVNQSGDVVGYYADANGTFHGFLLRQARPAAAKPASAAKPAH